MRAAHDRGGGGGAGWRWLLVGSRLVRGSIVLELQVGPMPPFFRLSKKVNHGDLEAGATRGEEKRAAPCLAALRANVALRGRERVTDMNLRLTCLLIHSPTTRHWYPKLRRLRGTRAGLE